MRGCQVKAVLVPQRCQFCSASIDPRLSPCLALALPACSIWPLCVWDSNLQTAAIVLPPEEMADFAFLLKGSVEPSCSVGIWNRCVSRQNNYLLFDIKI